MLPLLVLTLTVTNQSSTTAPAPAPTSSAAQDGPSNERRIVESSTIGRLLYAFDRAAWVSTDALEAAIPKGQLAGGGGYVVELAEAQTLRVTYYRGHADDARAFFIADVRDGKVVHGEKLAPTIALTPRQTMLARAREIAATRAVERSYKPCTPFPFNTVVLPSRDDGPVAVYLLTAQHDAHAYVMGGNYRVVVGPDGGVLGSRPYNVSCLTLTRPQLPPGAKPVGFMVNHLLDPVPTEIHVFASYTLGMPLFVSTPDRRMWKVQGAAIALSQTK